MSVKKIPMNRAVDPNPDVSGRENFEENNLEKARKF